MRANRYVSYLAAEIEPKAIQTIKRFEDQTERVFSKIDALKSRSRIDAGLVSSNTRAVASLKKTDTALAKTRTELTGASVAMRQTARSADVMSIGLSRAGSALQVVQGPLGPLAGRLTALGAIFRSLAGIGLAGVLAGGGAFGLGGVASSYQNVTDKLRPFYETQQETNAAMNEVVGIANRSRQALEPVAELYNKITQASRDAGIEQSRNARIIETVAKAGRLSGGSEESQKAGLTQFSQGFGSGILGGEELKSVRENTFRLAKAIADGLDVPIAKLKELGAEGKLTPQVIAEALERSADQIELEYSRLPKRIGSSLTELGTNFSVFVGQLDEFTGTTTAVATVLSGLANNLDTVAAAGAAALIAFNGRALVSGLASVSGGLQSYIGNINKAVQAKRFLNEQQASGNLLYATEVSRLNATNAAGASRVASLNARKAALQDNLRLLDAQEIKERKSLSTANQLFVAQQSQSSATIAKTKAVKGAEDELTRTRLARYRLAQQLAAVETQLGAANTRLAATTAAATAAQVQQNAVMSTALARFPRLASVVNAVTVSAAGLRAGLGGLTAFMGGPLGIALAVAAGGYIYLASQTDEALEASKRFEQSQNGLQDELGQTTEMLAGASAAARQFAVDMRIAAAEESKQKFRKAEDSLTRSFDVGSRGIIGADAKKARDIVDDLNETGFKFERDYKRITDIMRRNPGAFKGNFTTRLFGVDPADVLKKISGVRQSAREYLKTVKELDEIRDAVTSAPPPINIPTSRTKTELNNAAAEAAAVGQLAKETAKLKTLRQRGKAEGQSEQDYIEELSQQIQLVNGLKEAEKSRTAGANAASKAERARLAAERKAAIQAERSRDNRSKLENAIGPYEDAPDQLEKLEKTKRQIADLIGEQVEGFGTFSIANFKEIADTLDQSIRKPIEDILQAQLRELEVSKLIATGREEEARLLQIKYDLVDRIGDVEDDDLDTILDNIRAQQEVNDLIEQRGRLVDNYARLAGTAGDALQGLFRDSLGGDVAGGLKNFANNIKNAYLDALSQEFRIKLIGDPEKKARDELTRNMNSSAKGLTDAGTKLDQAAVSLMDAAAAQTDKILSQTGINGPAPVKTEVSDGMQKVAATIAGLDAPADALDSAAGKLEVAAERMNQDIVVNGRLPAQDESLPDSLGSFIDKGISGLVGGVFGASSPITKALGSVGKIAEAAAFGSLGGGLAQGLGADTSSLGSSIGGVAGKAIGAELFSSLGMFAGPLGAIAGGLIGGVVGGLFKKKKYGTAVVTGGDPASIVGNDGNARQAADTLAGEVQSGLMRIVDALGGELGRFNLSIGQYKGKFRVSTTGRTGKLKGGSGRPDIVDFGEDGAQEAVAFAILDAISDGAVQGIRASTQRLLQAGDDLERALDQALRFESVFTRLKRFKDPVGAAVDDVNKEFRSLIKIFGEAGASAAEYADLEELYGFERAAAIEQASNSAVSALDDFITRMTSSSESPLSRRDVYDNARSDVEEYRADIEAGKLVNQDELITALENFQEASRELYGSKAGFFADFDDILDLAAKARDASSVTGSTGTLPASPFEEDSYLIQRDQLNAMYSQSETLKQILAALQNGGASPYQYGGGGGGSGVLAMLPYLNFV